MEANGHKVAGFKGGKKKPELHSHHHNGNGPSVYPDEPGKKKCTFKTLAVTQSSDGKLKGESTSQKKKTPKRIISSAYVFSLYALKKEDPDVICLQEYADYVDARRVVEDVLGGYTRVACSGNQIRASMVFVKTTLIQHFHDLNDPKSQPRHQLEKKLAAVKTADGKPVFTHEGRGRLIAMAKVTWLDGSTTLIISAHSEHKVPWNDPAVFKHLTGIIAGHASSHCSGWDSVIFAGDLNTHTSKNLVGNDTGFSFGDGSKGSPAMRMLMPEGRPGPKTTTWGDRTSDHVFTTIGWKSGTDQTVPVASDHYIRICVTAGGGGGGGGKKKK